MSLAQERLQHIVDSGRQRSADVIRRVMTEIPTDSVVNTRQLVFFSDPDAGGRLRMGDEHLQVAWDIHPNALSQVAERTKTPSGYIRELAMAPSAEGWKVDLAATILNTYHSRQDNQRRLVRSHGNTARGVLSTAYRPLDAARLLNSAVDAAGEVGAIPYQGSASDVRSIVKFIVPQVFEPMEGEALVFGFEWSNSDYGKGPYSLRQFVMRLVCLNGMTGESELRQVHLGARLADGIAWSPATIAANTETLLSGTHDVVRGTLGPASIDRQLDAIRRAGETTVGSDRAFQRVARNLNKAELTSAREAFDSAEDILLPVGKTKWRAANTLSHMANRTEDAERAAELQALSALLAA